MDPCSSEYTSVLDQISGKSVMSSPSKTPQMDACDMPMAATSGILLRTFECAPSPVAVLA